MRSSRSFSTSWNLNSSRNSRNPRLTTNGFPVGADSYYFGGGDPQFVIGNISEEKRLRIEIEIMKAQDAGEKFWKSFGLVSAEKDEEIRRLKEKISQMENTKVWKLYRSIKKK